MTTHIEDKTTPIKRAPNRPFKNADILGDKETSELSIAKSFHWIIYVALVSSFVHGIIGR
jgi:hypothetical protein